jgi:hypothetical protein
MSYKWWVGVLRGGGIEGEEDGRAGCRHRRKRQQRPLLAYGGGPPMAERGPSSRPPEKATRGSFFHKRESKVVGMADVGWTIDVGCQPSKSTKSIWAMKTLYDGEGRYVVGCLLTLYMSCIALGLKSTRYSY